MSKIGEKLITINDQVTVDVQKDHVSVAGKEGKLDIQLPYSIGVEKKDNTISVKRFNETKMSKSLHGLMRSLIQNAIMGVSTPWQKRLEVVGTGFRVKMQGVDISLEVGFSHSILFKKIDGITLALEGANKIIISGVDKQLVGQVAYQIKALKKPDPYKGKGIRYEGEHIKLKAGKKAKTAGAK